MTRSIFDPDGGQAEQSGSRNLGGDAEAAASAAVPPVQQISGDATTDDAQSGGPDEDRIDPAFGVRPPTPPGQ